MNRLFGKHSPFKRSVFFKIFVSLMSLTLVPIFFLGLTSYFVFYRSMESQSDEFDSLILSTMSERIDRDLDDVKEILFRYALFLDIEQDNYGRILNVVRELGGIAGTSDFIEDIFVYYIDTDQVLTQKGIYYGDVFFDKVYRYEGAPGRELQHRLKQQNNFSILSTAPVIQDSFVEKRYVTILNSVPIREEPRANLVVLVDESYLYSIVESTGFESKGSQIAIINSDLELITGSIEESLDQDRLKTILIDNETEIRSNVYRFHTGSISVFQTQSQVTDWHYLVFSPARQISRKAASIRNITLWICAVLTLVSFLLTWVISMNLYNPIREIVNTIGSEPIKNQDPADRTDELNYILSHVKYVTDRNKSLDNSMKQVEPAFRDHYLRSLILGIPNRMISESGSGFKLNWPYKHFAVVVVQTSFEREITPSDYSHDSITDDFLRYLEDVLHASDGLVGVLTYIGKTQMTILVNLQSERILDDLLNEVETQIERYADKYRCAITLGVGEFCTTMSQINGSYEEALRALRFRKINTKSQILRFNSMHAVPKNPSALNYPIESERKLMYSVLAGDFEKVEETLNLIIADNLFGDTTYDQIITLFDQFLGTAGKILNKDKSGKLKFDGKELLNQFRFNKPDNLDVMRKGVLEIYQQLTEAFLQNRREEGNELRERLIRYIHNNYHDPEISLDSIAGEFDLNSKYVSRYFKEQTGTNYLDYLNMIRVSRAKELLIQKEKLKIVEISKKVGFYNVNTFISAFKRTEGVTPGAFRKLSV